MKPNENILITADDLPQSLIDGVVSTLGVPRFANPDMHRFVRLLFGSMSLSLVEKNRVLESVSTLTNYQFDELNRVFVEEQHKFEQLSEDNFKDTIVLNARTILGACLLACLRGAGYRDKDVETSEMQRMIRRKVRHSNLKARIDQMLFWRVEVRYLFGRALYPQGQGPWEIRRFPNPRREIPQPADEFIGEESELKI